MREATTPLAVAGWLAVALLAHCLVALFAVLSRWAQTRPVPPVPALRLALILNLLALAAMLALVLLQRARAALLQAFRRRSGNWPPVATGSQRQQQQQREWDPHGASGMPSSKPASTADAGDGIGHAGGQAAAPSSEAGQPPELAAGSRPDDPLQRQGTLYGRRHGAQQRPVPEVYLARGLSGHVRGLEARWSPRAVRGAALALLSASYAVGSSCQIVAAGWVDASVIQLVMLFTVFGVGLTQWLLLHHRLPWLLWPCALGMLGGCTMVLAPTIGGGATSAGGLGDLDGWLGLALSVCTMLATVVNFVTLQASRGLGFTATQLQLCYLPLTILALLPLSLGVDGAAWSAQFAGWSAAQWVLLVTTGTVVYLGGNFLLQNATWALGAPLVAMLYGLRVVAAIAEQQVILGTTVLAAQPALQASGVCLAVVSVSLYMYAAWRRSRQGQAL